jgi:hypothetical protein
MSKIGCCRAAKPSLFMCYSFVQEKKKTKTKNKKHQNMKTTLVKESE